LVFLGPDGGRNSVPHGAQKRDANISNGHENGAPVWVRLCKGRYILHKKVWQCDAFLAAEAYQRDGVSPFMLFAAAE
jgi:hypothetical protein